MVQPFWMAIWIYAQRALKDCLPFDPFTTVEFIPQRDKKEKDLYNHIYSHALCGGKKLEMRLCPSIREWLNKLWYLLVMEYYCA